MSTFPKRNLAGGELSPELHARTDLEKYSAAVRTLRNFFIKRTGGVENRSGSVFVAETKDPFTKVRLIPFRYQLNDIILEFGNFYLRWHINGVQARESALPIQNIFLGTSTTIESISPHGLSTNDFVYLDGILGTVELNKRVFRVTVITSTSFIITDYDGALINSSAYTPYISGGTFARIREISTPYASNTLHFLKYAQISATQPMFLVHPQHQPRELSFDGITFTFTPLTVSPQATPPTLNAGTGSGVQYVVTTILASGEESLPSNTIDFNAPAPSNNIVIGAAGGGPSPNRYRLYRRASAQGMVFGFVSDYAYQTTSSYTIQDTTSAVALFQENRSIRFPTPLETFNSSGKFPSCVCFHNQRLVFAATRDDPKTVWLSHLGSFRNFTFRLPANDADGIGFIVAGPGNRVTNVANLGRLIIFTDKDEQFAGGNEAGLVTPTQINLKTTSQFGCDPIQPLTLDNTILFVQFADPSLGSGTIVRDFEFSLQEDGYKSTDITAFARHLFHNKKIVDWVYQKLPHSIVWIVLDDGKILGCTYIREQKINGWYRGDTDGEIESVAVGNIFFSVLESAVNSVTVPVSANVHEDALFWVVRRVINGKVRKYVEYLSNRDFTDIRDYIGMDAAVSYDGRNKTSTELMLSGGTNWTASETLTISSISSIFTADLVGQEIHLYSGSDVVKMKVTSFVNANTLSGKPNKTVPVSLRNTPTRNWAYTIKTMRHLWHLEGRKVSVFADGHVISNPNNPSYNTITVQNGTITLPYAAAVVHVGIPYTSDLETLDVDVIEGDPLKENKIAINRVSLQLYQTRGLFVAQSAVDDASLSGMAELKLKFDEGYDEPVDLFTGVTSVIIEGDFEKSGRVFIRQSDPVPATINAIFPSGFIRT